MKKLKKFPWLVILTGIAAILFIMNFNEVVKWMQLGWKAVFPLVAGGCLAFLINLLMDPIEQRLKKTPLAKASRGLALLLAFIILAAIFTGLSFLVFPQLFDSVQLLIRTFPTYVKDIQDWLTTLFRDRPEIVRSIQSMKIDWDSVFKSISGFLTNGLQGAVDSTFTIISGVVGTTVNAIIMVIFAIYLLTDKERFVGLYHRLCHVWMKPAKEQYVTHVFVTLYDSFRAFVVGQCLEAVILGVTITVGMMVLKLPYAAMIGTVVGVTNIIPMIGAFIGGGIGAFLVFTVSPMQALIFLVDLIIVQQIESNILYPRIVGNSIGLPGIYVMIVVVVGGNLAGIPGMVIGIPLAAAVYKLVREWFETKERASAQQNPEKEGKIAVEKEVVSNDQTS